MARRTWIARTRTASGRFLFPLLVGAAGCKAPPPVSAPAPPERFPDPVLQRGPISPAREAHAAELFRTAEEALAAGSPETARANAQAGPGDQAGSVARSALEGGGSLGTLTLGSVLPVGGSPAFRELAEALAEGIEVAATTYLEGVAVSIEARDDRGDPSLAAALVADLEQTSALGIVGFLEDGALGAAAARRTGAISLVSPTARTAAGEGVYTLSGSDPLGAAAMARYAARQGFRRVAMLHSTSPESREEADAFASALAPAGIPVTARLAYDPSSTFFQEQILGAREALRGEDLRAGRRAPGDTLGGEPWDPVALFVPVPPEDVELLAPQLTFYGLDTLGIQILGTSGWTDEQTLAIVDIRHTDGVAATAPVGGGRTSAGYRRFREAYERRFQRTLVGSTPALGYDAAVLLLEAARTGARTPAQLRSALERIRTLEGATGRFSVIGGRVVRHSAVVRIQHGILLPTG